VVVSARDGYGVTVTTPQMRVSGSLKMLHAKMEPSGIIGMLQGCY
jgi:hypothetical protein